MGGEGNEERNGEGTEEETKEEAAEGAEQAAVQGNVAEVNPARHLQLTQMEINQLGGFSGHFQATLSHNE